MSPLSIALSNIYINTILYDILLCQSVRGMVTFGKWKATKIFVIQ